MRKTRGDGNCFYRAFGFSYLQELIGNQKEYERWDMAVKNIAWPRNTPAEGMHKYLISASQLTAVKQAFTNVQKLNQSASKVWHFTIALGHHSRGMIAFSTGVFIERARMVLIAKAPCWNSWREEEMGWVKGTGEGEGAGRKKRNFFLPSPSPLFFFCPHAYRKGYYFYSPQSSSVIESKMAASS